MKKIVAFLSFLILICMCYLYVNSLAKDGYNIDVDKIYMNNKSDVDKATNELMNNGKYKQLDDDNKIDIVGKLLKKYELANKIENLYYDDNNKMYTFKYSDGVLGGIMIKEFAPYLN